MPSLSMAKSGSKSRLRKLDVVVDADGEVVLGLGLLELVEDGLGHRRRELGRAEAVAAADDGGPGLEGRSVGPHGLADGGADVLVQGLADGARLLGAVEDGDGLDGGGDGLDEVLDARRGGRACTLRTPTFSPFLSEVVDGLLDDVGAGAHHDDDALGVGGARRTRRACTRGRRSWRTWPWSSRRWRGRRRRGCWWPRGR